jgi:hypothetical protein
VVVARAERIERTAWVVAELTARIVAELTANVSVASNWYHQVEDAKVEIQ